MPLLFSYGSNHPAQLEERLGHAVEGLAAYAPDYQRAFRGFSRKWEGSVATLIKKKGGKTYGYVARVDEDDLDVLDGYEGSLYARTPITVITNEGKKVKAIAYTRKGNEPFVERPSRAYLEAVAKTIGSFWEGDEGPVSAEDITIR